MRSGQVRWVLILTLSVLCVFVSACHHGDGKESAGSTEQQSETSEGVSASIRLDSEGLAQYSIIVSADATDAERNAAVKLQAAFRSRLQVELPIKADLILETAGYVESAYEIAVGRTNRSFAPRYSFENARTGEYCVVKHNAKLLIAGAKDAGTEQAVDWFIREWLSPSGAGEFQDSDSLIQDNGVYPLKSMTLNGTEMGSFNLSFRASSPLLKLKAEQFSRVIETEYGYFASVNREVYGTTLLLGTSAQYPQYADLLGTHSAALTALDGAPAIIAKDENALVCGVHELNKLILKGADSIMINDQEVSQVLDPSTLSTMTFNLAGGADFDKRKAAVLDVISSNLPSVLGIQEGKVQWLTLLSQLSVYACVGEGNQEEGYTETYNNLYYRKDLFELVDGGTFWLSDTGEAGSKFPESKRVRIATYACLRVLKTGEEILYVNTHLDNQSAEAREK